MFRRVHEAGLLVPSVLALVGLVVLVSLGTWQLQRRTWKLGIIAQIAERTTAPPVPVADLAGKAFVPADSEYRRVRVRGRFQNAREIHLHANQDGVAGWYVVTPLELSSGALLFVNRGFVPEALKDPAKRPGSLIEGEAEFTGVVRSYPAARGAFIPENDIGRNQWYWLDLPAMRRYAIDDPGRAVVPFLVEMEPVHVAVPPAGGATRLVISNRHLEYALTWYGLALTLVGVFAAFAWGRLRAAGTTPP